MNLAAPARHRRTQAERTAATRARLLDATVACLVELGYSGTTTPEIARRAGVSRGAQLHHFPTKAELVSSAADHIFRQRETEFEAAMAGIPDNADRVDAAVDVLWGMAAGPSFHAWLELAVAARTDPDLARHMQPVARRFDEEAARIFGQVFPAADAGGFARVVPTFVFAVLDGLTTQRIIDPDDEGRAEAVLDLLKQLGHMFLIPTEETP